MVVSTDLHLDWAHWLRRWDAQQEEYLPDREGRFAAMLDVLEVLFPEEFLALDLCCGPGSISQRLLARFPRARAVAADLDPVLLTLGEQVLGTMGGRLRWAEVDLTAADWPERLDERQFDAVLTTTALHWLPAQYLIPVYHQLGRVVRPGGVFLNGDHLRLGPDTPTLRRVADSIWERTQATAGTVRGGENWSGWWAALEAEPGMAELFAERERRSSWRTKGWIVPGYDTHRAALLDAGFREVGVIWQHIHNRVLMAVR